MVGPIILSIIKENVERHEMWMIKVRTVRLSVPYQLLGDPKFSTQVYIHILLPGTPESSDVYAM